MKEGHSNTVYLKDYTPPLYLIDTVDLRFELDDDFTVVRAVLAIRRNPGNETDNPALVLHGECLELLGVALDDRELGLESYSVDRESLQIHHVPERFQLAITTRLRPQDNTTLEGLYKSSGNFCTQCEAEGFRKITYFLDRPDVMAVYTTTIVADKASYPVLLSNGNLIEQGDVEANRHFATWHDPFPKPSYLFALVAGQLVCKQDTFVTQSGREIALRIYVEPHNIDKCDHAMASLKKAMRWDEDTFHLEYDLDIYMIVAVDDFNMGAMENKGLNVFNSKYILALPETATDQDYEHIEGVIAHEYFHNWTGNRVTCRDWFQLSLKEGLTVFRDQEFTADVTSRAVKRIDDVRQLRSFQFPEDAGPMAHPVRPQSYMEINNFYTVTVYEKGAEVVRMYQTLLGQEGFRKGLALYFERHDGQAVTTDNFAAAMADANQVDLTQFKRWYNQAGTPELTIKSEWNEAESTYTLEVQQYCPPTPEQPDKAPFHIPFRVGLLDEKGIDISAKIVGKDDKGMRSRSLDIREDRQRFTFTGIGKRPVPSLLRGFSAPVKLKYDYSDEDLAFLLANDSDTFNRWEAGQRLAIRQLQALIKGFQGGKEDGVSPSVLEAYKHLLSQHRLDSALVAEILTLPGETYLAELMDEIDVDAIHQARESMRRSLAETLESLFRDVYQRCAIKEKYQYAADHAGRRALKNLCLAYLTQLDHHEFYELAMRQFRDADNMTDTMGALRALINSDRPERDEALELFHERWRHDTLVMDKWFSLQAISSRTDSLKKVTQLMTHPLFSLRNPNKVRALIGAFASGNPVSFHQISGAGYTFVADRVLELDKINPQVAARLAKAFSRWKKYDGERRDLMMQELERIGRAPKLSKDVFEIVSKSLGAQS